MSIVASGQKVASLSESSSIKGINSINSLFKTIFCLNQVPSCCRGATVPVGYFPAGGNPSPGRIIFYETLPVALRPVRMAAAQASRLFMRNHHSRRNVGSAKTHDVEYTMYPTQFEQRWNLMQWLWEGSQCWYEAISR